MKQDETLSITEGVIWRGLLYFFFPILFGTFFQQLYSTVDAVIVGRFVGKEALAAVGGGTSFYVNMLVGFFTGLSSGAGVVISQLYGAKRKRECRRAVHTSLVLSLCAALVIMAAGIALSDRAMRIIGTPPDIFPLAVMYLRIYFCGMIPLVVYNMGSTILRAAGDSRTPFVVLVIGCAVNIVLDTVFVVVLGMSVAGVAAATVLSESVCAIITMRCLYCADDMIKFKTQELHLTPHIARKMVKLGLPNGLQGVMYTTSNLLIQSNINLLGTDAIAGTAAWGRIDQVFWMMAASFGIALTTFAGQNYGAGKLDRVKKATVQCLAMASASTVVLSIVLCAAGRWVFRLFTADEAVIECGMRILYFIAPTFITYVSVEILSGALRGMGIVAAPTLMTLFGVCALRFVWMLTVVPRGRTLLSIYVSYPITWSATSLMFWAYWFITMPKIMYKRLTNTDT